MIPLKITEIKINNDYVGLFLKTKFANLDSLDYKNCNVMVIQEPKINYGNENNIKQIQVTHYSSNNMCYAIPEEFNILLLLINITDKKFRKDILSKDYNTNIEFDNNCFYLYMYYNPSPRKMKLKKIMNINDI